MKVWELIKHLDEGGEIRHSINKTGETFCWDEITAEQWVDPFGPLFNSEMYEIVKPKKKVKLKAYLQPFHNYHIETGDKSYKGLVYNDEGYVPGKDDVRVPEEDKEIEVGE
jgi:hypothetical protein